MSAVVGVKVYTREKVQDSTGTEKGEGTEEDVPQTPSSKERLGNSRSSRGRSKPGRYLLPTPSSRLHPSAGKSARLRGVQPLKM